VKFLIFYIFSSLYNQLVIFDVIVFPLAASWFESQTCIVKPYHTDRCRRRNFEMREWTGADALQVALGSNPCMLIWPTKHVTSLTLSYQQTATANRIIAIARIHRRTDVYSFLSVGPTYRAMGKVVACRTIFISNLSLQ